MRLRHASLCCCLLGLAVPAVGTAAEPVAPARPLRLGLDMEAVRIEPARRGAHQDGNAMPHRGPAAPGSPAQLRQQALQGLLSPPEQADALAGSGTSPFRFRRQGNVGSEMGRDLRRGYQNMCDNVSRKVWDDPNGKRVKFDVAGKPGIGFEIPIR